MAGCRARRREVLCGLFAEVLGVERVGIEDIPFLGYGRQDRLGDLAENVEGTHLMGDVAEDCGDRLGIKRRAITGDPLEGQTAGRQGPLEAAEQRHDVLVNRIAVEDLVEQPLEGAVVDDREDAEGSVIQLVNGDEAREVRQCPVEMLGIDPPRRLFPPGLDPVLDRGVRDKHAVVAPEGPFGDAIGQAVLDDQPDGEVGDAARVMAAGVGQVGHIGAEVLTATGAIMLGIEHNDVARPPGKGVAQVMEGPPSVPVAVGAVAAPRAGAPPVVAALDTDLGFGQILGPSDAHSGIGAIFAGSWHGEAPGTGRSVLPGTTSETGKVFTNLARFLCYRL